MKAPKQAGGAQPGQLGRGLSIHAASLRCSLGYHLQGGRACHARKYGQLPGQRLLYPGF